MILTSNVLTRVAVFASLIWLTACAGVKIGDEASDSDSQTQAALEAEQAKEREKEKYAGVQSEFAEGVEWLAFGDTNKAETRFQALHDAYPEFTGPIANLGLIAFQRGDKKTAQLKFEQVISINPQHHYALNYLGVIAREDGRFKEAEEYYRRALEVDKDYPAAIRNLAILLDIYQGKLKEALPLYERYQTLAGDRDPRVKDWIFDLKQRLK